MTIEKAMKQAKGSLQIDGYIVKPEHHELVHSLLIGQIDDEEFDKQLQALLSLREGSE